MLTDGTLTLGLLFALAAALGWGAARWTARSRQQKRLHLFDHEYFRGLNFLLNEQPDKALEVFVRMVEADSDTVETHFALGSLFRRRGEVDRAIRIHQNLIARPTLSPLHRAQALYELAEDYMRAGLFDRAENLFQDLVRSKEHVEPALRNLITIYEQQKDWEQAIAAAEKYEAATGVARNVAIAQYHCELAEQAREKNERRRAWKHLKRAQSLDPACLRARLLQAELAREEGDKAGAIRQLRRALERDPQLATEVLAPFARLCAETGDTAELAEAVTALKARSARALAHVAMAGLMDPGLEHPIIRDCVETFLASGDGMQPLREFVTLVAGEDPVASPEIRARVAQALRRIAAHRPHYRCGECGFTAKTLFWQCPSCRTWDSIRPHFDFAVAQVTANPPSRTG